MAVLNSENGIGGQESTGDLSQNPDYGVGISLEIDDGDGTDSTSPTNSHTDNENSRTPMSIIQCPSKLKLEALLVDAAKNTHHPVPAELPDKVPQDHNSTHHSIVPVGLKKWTAKNTTVKKRSILDWSSSLLPCIRWLRTYKYSDNLISDICAGLTVGIMIVPQSMSYAKLAGLPVEYGLYSALVPVYAYAVFGSSRQLAVGPVALVSLMLSSGLTAIVTGEEATGGEISARIIK